MSPPEVSLGIHELPADTHNGDTISIKDQDFIVSSLTMRWRLEGGKYKRYHHRLDVVGVFRLCSVHNISGRKARLVQPAESDLCLQMDQCNTGPTIGLVPTSKSFWVLAVRSSSNMHEDLPDSSAAGVHEPQPTQSLPG